MLSEMKFKHLTIITFKFYEADIPRFRFKSARTELPFSPRGSSQPFRAPRSPLGACGDITVSPGRALTSEAHTEPRNCDLTAAGSHGGAREGGGDAPLTCAGTPPPTPRARQAAPPRRPSSGRPPRGPGTRGRTTSGPGRADGAREDAATAPPSAAPRGPRPQRPAPPRGATGAATVSARRAPAPPPGPPVLLPGRGLARGCGSPMRRRQA